MCCEKMSSDVSLYLYQDQDQISMLPSAHLACVWLAYLSQSSLLMLYCLARFSAVIAIGNPVYESVSPPHSVSSSYSDKVVKIWMSILTSYKCLCMESYLHSRVYTKPSIFIWIITDFIFILFRYIDVADPKYWWFFYVTCTITTVRLVFIIPVTLKLNINKLIKISIQNLIVIQWCNFITLRSMPNRVPNLMFLTA